MKLSKIKFLAIMSLMLSMPLIFSGCGQEISVVEELQNSNLIEDGWQDDAGDETVHLASYFLVDLGELEDDEIYDYIVGYEHFGFNLLFLRSRWNSLVDEINWSFGWGSEAYEYIHDNYDELWEMLVDQLHSEVAVTFLAYKLGFEADEREFSSILDDMESSLAEAREEGVDIDTIFLETFGTTQENWEVQVNRQLASIIMIDAMWEEYPLTDEMIQRLKDDVPFDNLPQQANVYHVLVDSEEEAWVIYEKMQEGIHPRDLHEEFSQDPGGPHYIFPQGVMVEPFEEWAFQAEAGDIGIVPTQFGFHVTLSYGKELYTEELEHLARLHYLDLHIIDLIRDLDIRWGSQPGDSWVPRQ